jgi:hypothetical protein
MRQGKDFILKSRIFVWGLSVVLTLASASMSFAVVKDGRIETVPGFRFENVIYGWDQIFIDVVNMTDRNTMFGGTMVFLDRRGNPVASVRLLPAKVVRDSVRRYKSHFVKGTGETARRAARVIWDFSPR